jgi:glycosyltransferase involved in cell wall biosynthesis
MVTAAAGSDSPDPMLSVIIPVYERRAELDLCLSALERQQAPPPFEIIVVDDGSKTEVPAARANGAEALSPRVIHQDHLGIGAARNKGISAALGDILVFVDSDVVVGERLLRIVADEVSLHPEKAAFQIQLKSTSKRMSHRIENARLVATQRALRQPGGSISYVNTSAFAIRRCYTSRFESFFDTQVTRGEDTLILARLAREGLLPCFLPSTTADHRPPGSLGRYLAKHFKIGYQGTAARFQLSASGGIILSWPGRLRMLRYLIENSGSGMIGGIVSTLAITAYALEICGRAVGRLQPRAVR